MSTLSESLRLFPERKRPSSFLKSAKHLLHFLKTPFKFMKLLADRLETHSPTH